MSPLFRKFSFLLILASLALAGCSDPEKKAITDIEQANSEEYTLAVPLGSASMFAAEKYLSKAKRIPYTKTVDAF